LSATSMLANFLGAAVLMAAPWSFAKAEPRMLMPTQLDRVTAGGVYVDISTLVNALGHYARTVTEAQTTAIRGHKVDAGLGLGFGEGVACCGSDAAAQAQTEVAGVGDQVMGGTVSVFTHTGDMSLVSMFGWILAVSSPSGQELSQAPMQGLPNLGFLGPLGAFGPLGRLAPMWLM
jgi:hypothetical protein